MLRKRVIDTIKTVVEGEGYTLCNGFKYRITNLLADMPAAWLEPVAITQIAGRDHGRVRYKIVLYLMYSAPDTSEERKEQLWGAMEINAFNIIRALATSSQIIEVVSAQATPLEYNLTTRGEISCRIEAQIDMLYNRENYNV